MANQRIWNPDLYAEGSCIYEVDGDGDLVDLVGWAKNSVAAAAAFAELCARNPGTSYQQRRKSWVENERIVGQPPRKTQ
ncbi:hypothetical protein [Mesorhizobium sp. KR9-304]|uniref:hypothetical protein n=1 Tax=Mesorhizobium sp. KR9-304 TaxID=3156614 RepID=UPI0032B5D41E